MAMTNPGRNFLRKYFKIISNLKLGFSHRRTNFVNLMMNYSAIDNTFSYLQL